MEMSAPISGISKLHDDVLLYILELNSRPTSHDFELDNEDTPLDVVRAMSQVCSSWRGLLLGSSSIWARLLNVNYLANGNNEWRKEVLRRTQVSPLWITGSLNDRQGAVESSDGIYGFFLEILGHWRRVERFDMEIDLNGTQIDISGPLLNCLNESSPMLRVFRFNVFDLIQRNPRRESLFAGHAPSLVEFNAPLFLFPQDTLCFSNLQILHVPSGVKLSQTLDILSQTPLLRALYLNYISLEGMNGPFHDHSIMLPSLNAITMDGMEIPEMSIILNTIISSPGSSLRATGLPFPQNQLRLPSVVAHFLEDGLPTYVKGYFGAHAATRVQLSICGSRLFYLEDTSSFEEGSPFFHINIHHGVNENSLAADPSIDSMLARACTPPQGPPNWFSTVIELRLDLQYLGAGAPDVYNLVSSFSSVRIIESDMRGLPALISLCRYHDTLDSGPDSPLFPRLHALHLIETFIGASTDQILQFSRLRKEIGFPIREIWFPENIILFESDMDSFSQIDGLTIFWGTRDRYYLTFVCGTRGIHLQGNREFLRGIRRSRTTRSAGFGPQLYSWNFKSEDVDDDIGWDGA